MLELKPRKSCHDPGGKTLNATSHVCDSNFGGAGLVIELESNNDEILTLSVLNDTNYKLEGVVNSRYATVTGYLQTGSCGLAIL